eukprot:COSAG05_NODE_446_length_9772_cov_117.012923_4_plen_98_part_00
MRSTLAITANTRPSPLNRHYNKLLPAYYRSTGTTLRPTCESTDSTSTGYTGTGTGTVACEMQNERYAAARTPRVLPVQIQVQLTVLVCSTQDSRTLC